MIVRSVGDERADTLRYELRPDDQLKIELILWRDNKGPSPPEKAAITETFHLSPTAARQAREALWRLRPSKFQGVDQDTRPFGCARQSDHDWPETHIAFINQPEGTRPENASVGSMGIPYRRSCNTKAAEEARKVLQRVLDSFPLSKAASAFERLEKEYI